MSWAFPPPNIRRKPPINPRPTDLAMLPATVCTIDHTWRLKCDCSYAPSCYTVAHCRCSTSGRIFARLLIPTTYPSISIRSRISPTRMYRMNTRLGNSGPRPRADRPSTADASSSPSISTSLSPVPVPLLLCRLRPPVPLPSEEGCRSRGSCCLLCVRLDLEVPLRCEIELLVECLLLCELLAPPRPVLLPLLALRRSGDVLPANTLSSCELCSCARRLLADLPLDAAQA